MPMHSAGIASPILDARRSCTSVGGVGPGRKNALRKNGRTSRQHRAGQKGTRALDDMVKSAIGEIAAMQASGQTQVETGEAPKPRGRIEAMAVAFGMSAPEAEVRRPTPNIPTQVMTKIAADTTLAYRDIVALAQKLDSLRPDDLHPHRHHGRQHGQLGDGLQPVEAAVRSSGLALPSDSISRLAVEWRVRDPRGGGRFKVRPRVDASDQRAMRFVDGGFVSARCRISDPQPAAVAGGISVTGTLPTPVKEDCSGPQGRAR